MAARGTDFRLLALAASVVIIAVALALGVGLTCAGRHRLPSSPQAVAEVPPDAAPLPLPEDLGPRCGAPVVELVRRHPAKVAGKTIEEAAGEQIVERAATEKVDHLIIGFRGREDRERSSVCRVSYRYQLGEERGASVWLVDPEAPDFARLEPQDLLSVELTGFLAWDDPTAQTRWRRECSSAGVMKVQRHFSYKQDYDLWRALRKRAIEVRRETGATLEYGLWEGLAEAPDRCLVSVAYTEDGQPKRAYFRLRYLPAEEHAVEPLTPRAIEVIYGPGVFSR